MQSAFVDEEGGLIIHTMFIRNNLQDIRRLFKCEIFYHASSRRSAGKFSLREGNISRDRSALD